MEHLGVLEFLECFTSAGIQFVETTWGVHHNG